MLAAITSTAIESTEVLYAIVGILISVTGFILLALLGLSSYFLASLHSRFEAHIVESIMYRTQLTLLQERFEIVDEIKESVGRIEVRLGRREGDKDHQHADSDDAK